MKGVTSSQTFLLSKKHCIPASMNSVSNSGLLVDIRISSGCKSAKKEKIAIKITLVFSLA